MTPRLARLALALVGPAIAMSFGCGGPAPGAKPTTATTASAAPEPPLPPAPWGDDAALRKMIDAYAAGFGSSWGEAFAPSGYVAVARGGRPVYARAFGVVNPKTGTHAGENTRFRIGSLTKQFTAVATLKLAGEKKVSLDDSVRKWVPVLPAAFEPVTLSHLLAQTSGIESYTQDEALMNERGKKAEAGRVLATFKDKPLAFTPGAEFQYSNSNYFLLGLVIERASETSYEAYLQQKVLGPAKMTRTSTVDAPDAPDTAVGRTLDDYDNLADVMPIDMSVPFAAGALRSTAHDLLLWDRALSSHALLSPAEEKLRTTPVRSDYAFGVIIDPKYKHTVERHNGGIDGFSSYFARVPDLGIAVVVLMNQDAFDTDKLASSVLKMVMEGTPVPPPTELTQLPFDAKPADEISGEFALEEQSKAALEKVVPKAVFDSVQTTTVTTDGRKLTAKPNGQGAVQLYFGEGGVFFTKGSGIVVTPVRDAAGKVSGLSLQHGGLTIDYVRKN